MSAAFIHVCSRLRNVYPRLRSVYPRLSTFVHVCARLRSTCPFVFSAYYPVFSYVAVQRRQRVQKWAWRCRFPIISSSPNPQETRISMPNLSGRGWVNLYQRLCHVHRPAPARNAMRPSIRSVWLPPQPETPSDLVFVLADVTPNDSSTNV